MEPAPRLGALVEVDRLLGPVVRVGAEDAVDAHRQQVPGARLDGGERGRPRVLERQGVQDGGVTGPLQLRVQRRLDDVAAVVELLLADLQLLREVLLHEVADVGADARIHAPASRVRCGGEAQRCGRRRGLLRRRDVALLGHPVEHLVAADGRGLGVDERVVVAGALDEAGQQGGLGQRQRGRVHAEEGAGGRLDPVGVQPEIHDVEVPGEDLVLAVGVLERQRQTGLADLAGQRLLGGRVAPLVAVRRLQQGLLDQLLGQGGAALLHLPRRHVPDQCARRALHVHATVLVEAGVLDRDHRLPHDPGDLVARHRRAVLLVEVRDHLAVGGQHHGVARGRLVGELEWRITQEARRLLRHQGRTAHPRQQEPGQEGAGDDHGEGEHEQRADAPTHQPSLPVVAITSTENAPASNPPRRP